MTQPQAQADLDKVVQKIQKLFELAGRSGARGATEAEADTATRRAQELMARYNLDVAAIDAASREAADAGAASRVKEEQGRRTGKAWQRQLAKYVAEAHFCYHLIRVDKDWDDEARSGHGGWRKKAVHVFVGRKANVVTAQMMFAYLVDAFATSTPWEYELFKTDDAVLGDKADAATKKKVEDAIAKVRDVNGDGKLDIVTANEGSNTIGVLAGDGAGGFTPAADFVIGSHANQFVPTDLNGDGITDLVVGSFGRHILSLLLGKSSFEDLNPVTTAGPKQVKVSFVIAIKQTNHSTN